jgi:hypothetical protein
MLRPGPHSTVELKELRVALHYIQPDTVIAVPYGLAATTCACLTTSILSGIATGRFDPTRRQDGR